MKDRAPLTDILANPDDDAPRLAYAGWLKDNGDPARAEFIRVQCKRARLAPDDPAQLRLRQREKALLKKHGERWQAGLPEWARVGVVFRRGFVARVIIPLRTFVKRAAKLLQVAPLETLDLQSQEFDAEDVQALAQCPHAAYLTELNFWFTGLTNE